MEGKETITISKCPQCKKKHAYNLQVDRAIIMKFLTMDDLNEQPREVKVIRFFSCPIKNEKFQATITLYDSSSNRIKSVGEKTEINNDRYE